MIPMGWLHGTIDNAVSQTERILLEPIDLQWGGSRDSPFCGGRFSLFFLCKDTPMLACPTCASLIPSGDNAGLLCRRVMGRRMAAFTKARYAVPSHCPHEAPLQGGLRARQHRCLLFRDDVVCQSRMRGAVQPIEQHVLQVYVTSRAVCRLRGLSE